MYTGNSFGSAKVLFATIGVSFALIKVSVYSMIGFFTRSKEEHNTMMSSIEGFFMIGIASAYFIFPAFFDAANPDAWLRVYLLLAGLVALAFLLLLFSKMDVDVPKSEGSVAEDFMGMIKLIALPLVIFFVLSAFLFVMVEQGIMTWLPTFNHHVLALSDDFECADGQHFGFVAGGGALFGRPVGEKISLELKLLTVCLLLAMGIVAFVLPRALDYQAAPVHSFGDIPMIGFVFPLIGLFIAPVYPLIASATLSALPQKNAQRHDRPDCDFLGAGRHARLAHYRHAV